MNENKETCKLLLEDYQLILRNEIYSVIDRNPTDEETALFETYAHDYIADCLDDGTRPDFAGLCLALYDCRNENYKRCAECGEYYTFDEMNADTGHEFCLKCHPYYDPDWDWDCSKEDRPD